MRLGKVVIGLIAVAVWAGPASAHDEEHHILDTSEEGMKKIAHALGVKCTHCHTATLSDGKPDFKALSPFKATALHMKQHFVDTFKTGDGGTVDCLTCHQGTARFIPRDPEREGESLSSTMERKELMLTMRGFTKALGVKCLFCHKKAEDGRMDPTLPTKHRRMARFMRETFTGFKQLDGEPVTCVTCHQGKTKFLPRHGE